MKVIKCKGEGQGSCKRCTDNGKWNRIWMCFLSKIEGYEGCYCNDCVKAIQAESEDKMKIKAKTLFGELVTIINIEPSLESCYATAIVINKKGTITSCKVNTLTVIDEEYLPKEGEGENEL